MIRRPFIACAAAALTCASVAVAQEARPSVACDGLVVSRVDVHPERPPFSGAAARWRAAAHAIGLHHATTRDHVARAFVSLQPGMTCTEFRRAESERVLRAQPFLSDASVGTEPDGAGGVVVVVRTTDEVPVLIGGRFRGVAPEAFSIGNENVAGEALRLEASIERGRAYRTAFGMRVEQDALFGKPYRLILEGRRYQAGHELGAEVEHPFFTDLQRISWHMGLAQRNDYPRFERPARDELALMADDRSWDASALLRVFGTTTVGLLGGAVTGRRFDPAPSGIVVSDSGFVADTGVALRNRYRALHVGRIGVTGGLRRVTFQSVNGFDALVGSQDVARGAMLGLFAGRGISQFGERDAFLSGALYAGAARHNALLATLAQVEARRDDSSSQWNSAVGSARTALYWGSAPGAVLVIDDELSFGWRSRLPLQLTFRDNDGGLIGYRNSALAGATRNVVRAEVRFSAASLVHRADVGFATFSEVGTLWAGDAPYGVNATRAAVGVSLLAAYPTHSKRLYRADLAIPFTRSGEGRGRIELRFSSADRTQGFWEEPGDVSSARTGTEPSRLFAWPSR